MFMNLGRLMLDWTLFYEKQMEGLGLLSLVQDTTIWWKLGAMTLERTLRPQSN
ncbi:MAG: hypothetical protein ACK4SL_03945 [Candidatus Paceibacteria bacterium]